MVLNGYAMPMIYISMVGVFFYKKKFYPLTYTIVIPCYYLKYCEVGLSCNSLKNKIQIGLLATAWTPLVSI